MLPLFSATLFLSAALLFLVQPMFARFVLPAFGSTPAVWTTSMLFFQTALLAGYAYAHASTARLGARRQAAVHLALLALAAIALPLVVPSFVPRAEGSPVLALLGVLLAGVGLPFFAVAATGPLLQRWLAGTDHPAGRDPYFLYRASNLGSVVGLLGYPLLMEPRLRLAEQGTAWAAGYGLLALLVAACAVALWRSRPAVTGRERSRDAAANEPAPTVGRRARWIALAFVPSSLLLGVTAFITTDLAPVPLLWVVPLALYLGSFIVVFSPGRGGERTHRVMVLLLPVAMVALVIAIVVELRRPLSFVVPLHLAGFFVAAMVCHGELARDRPAARHLTGFYLWIALGGALGAAFNALAAPLLFDSLAEYGLVIVLACLARPPRDSGAPRRLTRVLDLALPTLLGLAMAVLLLAVARAGAGAADFGRSLIFGFSVGLLLNFARRPVRLALGLAAFMVAASFASDDGGHTLFEDRSFYGAHVVSLAASDEHLLVNGTTLHGAEIMRPGTRPEPLTYYHRTGPIGRALAALPRDAVSSHAAVIGLGTGSMACYAGPGEEWTFYELDPTVERIARDPRLFTFLRDCPGRHDVVLGDARLSLNRARPGGYELIVVDAFSSDAIPVHLITREALDLYLSRLTPDGVLAFHVTNRYLDLAPVVGALARERGLTCLADDDGPADVARVRGMSESSWVVMARKPSQLGQLPRDSRWRSCPRRPGSKPWTDDFSNVVSALRPF